MTQDNNDFGWDGINADASFILPTYLYASGSDPTGEIQRAKKRRPTRGERGEGGRNSEWRAKEKAETREKGGLKLQKCSKDLLCLSGTSSVSGGLYSTGRVRPRG